jgi:hypothetical protein
MHPLESGVGVPAFLAKLWRLVDDSETDNLIAWSSVSIFGHFFPLSFYFSIKYGFLPPKLSWLDWCYLKTHN